MTTPEATQPPRSMLQRVVGGGTAGNEELTAITAVVLLAGLGVTIVRLRQLLNRHMFSGSCCSGRWR